MIKISLAFFLITLVFLLIVPFIGIEVKGSKRWLDFGILPRFQPIELLKPYFIVFVSILLCLNKNIFYKYLLSGIVLLLVILLLTSNQILAKIINYDGMVNTDICFRNKYICIFLFFIFTISISTYLIFFVSKFEYIKIRLLSFLNTSTGNNYQADRASDAISGGGFLAEEL